MLSECRLHTRHYLHPRGSPLSPKKEPSLHSHNHMTNYLISFNCHIFVEARFGLFFLCPLLPLSNHLLFSTALTYVSPHILHKEIVCSISGRDGCQCGWNRMPMGKRKRRWLEGHKVELSQAMPRRTWYGLRNFLQGLQENPVRFLQCPGGANGTAMKWLHFPCVLKTEPVGIPDGPCEMWESVMNLSTWKDSIVTSWGGEGPGWSGW
jgi:hypothetical protein